MLEDTRGYLFRRKECQRRHHNSCTIKLAPSRVFIELGSVDISL